MAQLLQLVGVTNTFHRCTECAKLVRPAIVAHNNGSHSVGYHCFRCYHIMEAVVIAPFTVSVDRNRKEVK